MRTLLTGGTYGRSERPGRHLPVRLEFFFHLLDNPVLPSRCNCLETSRLPTPGTSRSWRRRGAADRKDEVRMVGRYLR